MTVGNTVLVSAGVSASVALGVEYLAKPALEARKERILESHRDAHRARRAFRLTESRLIAYIELHGFDSEGIDGQIRLAADALTEAISDLERAMGEPRIRMHSLGIRSLNMLQDHGVQWGYQQTAGVADSGLYRIAVDRLLPLCEIVSDALSHRWLTPRERRNIRSDLADATVKHHGVAVDSTAA